MQIKTLHPSTFLFFQQETTINELEQFIPVGQRLLAEAVKYNLFVTGPIHWHYENFSDVAKPFRLEVALPVAHAPADYDGEFSVKRTEPYKCVVATHEGGWMDIPRTYGSIMEFIATNSLVPNARSREVYINVDHENSQANITEIQMGVF